MPIAYTASEIFTGDEILNNYAVVVNNGIIDKVIPIPDVDAHTKMEDLGRGLLSAAFIDVQVYGAAQKILAEYPEPETLATMYREFIKTGTVLFLPTVATNTNEVMRACIDAVRAYWKQGGKGVFGLHLEGPWLNAEKRGAHVKEWIHAPETDEVKELLEYGKGVIKMITIAPEICSDEIIKLIRDEKIIISAGHSNATYTQAVESFAKGITTVTHLYNAMSPLNHREPGLAGAALNHDNVFASIIPDGHHVDFKAVDIARKLMGNRLFAITDAVTETDKGPYQHHLAGEKYESNGILSGSALTMHKAFVNLVRKVGIEREEALRMCTLYPARVLQSEHKYGKIAPGCAAQFLLLDKQLQIQKVIS